MKNQNGQSLVEALIALGAATIIVSAITVAAITAINNSDFSKYQNVATHYAAQGLEIVRQDAQSNWTVKIKNRAGNTYCLGEDNLIQSSGQPPSNPCVLSTPNLNNEKGTPFYVRNVSLSWNTGGCTGSVQAIVSVSWTDGKCATTTPPNYCHAVKLSSCFANVNNALP